MICGCVGVRECRYIYRVIVFIRNYEFYSFVYNLYYFFGFASYLAGARYGRVQRLLHTPLRRRHLRYLRLSHHIPIEIQLVRRFKLAVVQICIETAFLHQFLVRSALNDIAVFHDENAIGIPDGRETVGYHKAGTSLGERIHRFLYLLFGSGIDTARRFVQYDERRILDHGARNGEKLLLPG